MSEKVKNRKPLGRHITKGNFEEIDGGPDIQSIAIIEDFGSEFEEDPYEQFDEEDFIKQHAAFQSEIKCIDKDDG